MSKKLKLTNLSETEMKKAKGGSHNPWCCACACYYDDYIPTMYIFECDYIAHLPG